jgi:hypothetical protein
MDNQVTTKPKTVHIYAVRNKQSGLYVAQCINAVSAQKFVDANAPYFEIVE